MLHKILSIAKQVFPLLWYALISILGVYSLLDRAPVLLVFGGALAGWCVTARIIWSEFDKMVAGITFLYFLTGVIGLLKGYPDMFMICAAAPAIGALTGLVHIRQVRARVDSIVGGS